MEPIKFHNSWEHGMKRRTPPNLGENARSESKAHVYDAKSQPIFQKKDGCRAQISSVEHEFLGEIHP